jgi:hypothetical protein
MKDGNVNIANPIYAIFPIIKEIDNGIWEIIGTGFYITPNGVFVSAKHVLDDVIEKKTNTQKYPIFLAHFYDTNFFLIRPICEIILANDADIALGLPAEMKYNDTGALLRSKGLTLPAKTAFIGDKLTTYAYLKSYVTNEILYRKICLNPNYYDGTVVKYYRIGASKNGLCFIAINGSFFIRVKKFLCNAEVLIGSVGR